MKEKIIEFCSSIGLDTVGLIPCRRFEELREFYQKRKENQLQNEFEEDDIEKRIDPFVSMEKGKTILSIAFPYQVEEDAGWNGFSIYTKRPDYHRVVMLYLKKICEFIESLGGQAVPFVDSNSLPERYIAYLAGIGFIGRNNMLITKKYGSYVFLGEIIMSLDVECKDKRVYSELGEYKECGECRRCYQECPSKSINKMKVNPNICLSYITQKKEITKKEINLLRGNIFGCDFCQLACPYNCGVEKSTISEFSNLPFMQEGTKTFADMDNRYFKENVSKTSCGWRGKNVIRRNAIVQLAKEGEELSEYLGASPYINHYIQLLQENNHTTEEEDES